jgi:phospholipid/cholesterol/gamma-HCH transport system substrate-binding protein
MRMSDAAKVGLAVLAAAGMLVLLTFWLAGSMGFGGTYQQRVVFPNAQGLEEGGYVRVGGVEVGRVHRIELAPDGRALVTLRVRTEENRGYRIRREDAIRIVGGALGFTQPWVEITPGGRARETRNGAPGETPAAVAAGEVLTGEPAPGEVLEGETVADMNRLIDRGEELLEGLTRLTDRMTGLTETVADTLDDPDLQRNLRRTAENFARLSERSLVIAGNMESATARLDRLIVSFQGTTAQVDRTLRRADALVTDFQGTAQQTRELMADTRALVQDTRDVVRQSGGVLDETRGALKGTGELVQETREALAENRERLAGLFRGLDKSVEQLNATLAEAQAFVADPQLRGDLRATAENVREATENLRRLTADVQAITGDPQVQQDLRAAIAGMREVTGEATEALRRVRDVLGVGGRAARTVTQRLRDTEFDAQALHGARSNRTRFDFNATIPWTEDTFYRLGIYDLGESNRFNAQVGQQVHPGLWARYGFRASRVGVGLDVGDRLRAPFQVDIFGVRQPQVDIRGNFPIARYLDLTVGLDNLFRRPDPIFGIRYRR